MCKDKACCFFGHRKINETPELTEILESVIESLIKEKAVNIFYFGSKSEFDSLCLKVVTDLKEKYPHIKRIYVRAEFPYIDDSYKKYLLESYEDTYYPEKIKSSGKSAYIERNYEMINNSQICIIYYNNNNIISSRKSGTKIALDYAINKDKEILHFY